MDTVSALTERLIAENASAEMSQGEYNRRYDSFSERYDKAEKRCEALKRRKVTLQFEVDMVECFMTEVRLMPELPTGFSESHWNALVDHVTVYADDRMIFTFKNGSEITENL